MKKFLSLVLALVMTMSLVTVSAGAKDFTDSDKIQYTEAVDVMSAVKVIDGYTDGSFNPTATLTRGAAAKIICNLILGPTTANALVADAAPYKDVPTNHTFAGYIAYCQKTGIISGYADGTFKPANTLTGYAFMKMLLGALGYDAANEGYNSPNWSIAVAKQAINAGLNKGLNGDFNGVKAVNREEACLYAFNTLTADMVEYDKNSTVTVGNITIKDISDAKEKTCVKGSGNDGNIDKDGKVQFAEEYFGDLKGKSTTDAFERPATEWKVKSKSVGTYAKTPDLTYTGKTKISVIYSDLGLSDGISEKKVTEYVDGDKVTYTVAGEPNKMDIVKGNTEKVGGKGTLLDVYYDDDAETITFVEVNTYVAKIAAVRAATTTKDAYVVLNTADSFTKPTGVSTVGNYETDAFAKDDIVAYTYSKKSGDDGVQSMYLTEKVTGVMSGYTTEGSVTVSGTKYDANKASKANIAAFSATVDKGSDISVYLDKYGYGLYVDADTSAEYAVVLNYVANAGDFNDTAKAKLLFTDGTTQTVEVSLTAAQTPTINPTGSPAVDEFNAYTDSKVSKYDIVSYTVDSDKVYALTLVADAQAGKTGVGSFKLTNGSNEFSVVSGNVANVAGAKQTTSADGKTIFLVADTSGSKTSYSVYEGFANVPTIKHNGGAAGTVAVFMNSTINGSPAKVVFIEKNARMTMTTDNKDVVFIKGSSVGSSYTTALGTYFEYDAFVNGKEDTVKVTTAVTSDTLVYGPSYDAKGLLVLANCEGYVNASNTTAGTDMKYVIGTDSVVNDVIKLGGQSGTAQKAYAYASDVNVYYISVGGKLIASDITAIAEDANDVVFLKTNDKGRLTEVYIRVVDETAGVGTTTGSLASAALAKDGSNDLVVGVSLTSAATSAVTGTVVVEQYMTVTDKWVQVATGTVTVATGNTTGQSAALIASGSVVHGTIYRATVTMADGVRTTANFVG